MRLLEAYYNVEINDSYTIAYLINIEGLPTFTNNPILLESVTDYGYIDSDSGFYEVHLLVKYELSDWSDPTWKYSLKKVDYLHDWRTL